MKRLTSRVTGATMLALVLTMASGGCKPQGDNDKGAKKNDSAKKDEASGLSLMSTLSYSGFLPVRRSTKVDVSGLDRSNTGVDAVVRLIGMRQYAWIACDESVFNARIACEDSEPNDRDLVDGSVGVGVTGE